MSTPAGAALYARMTTVATQKVLTYGALVQVYRKMLVRQPDASVVRTWAPHVQTTIFIDVIDTATARRLWGSETAVTSQGVPLPGADVTTDDGLQVLDGPFAGQRFLVKSTDDGPVTRLLGLVTGPREAFA